jgi:hypothetical protein
MKGMGLALCVGVMAALVVYGRLPPLPPEPGTVKPVVLELHLVVDGTPEMQELAARAVEDPRAAALGVKADVDSWFDEEGDQQHSDYFLRAEDGDALRRYVADSHVALPPGRGFGYERVQSRTERKSKAIWRTYMLEREVLFSGRDIAAAEMTWDQTTNRPEVMVTLDAAAKVRFGEVTAANVGRKIAIVLDGVVQSAPVVQSAIRGGKMSITMGGGDANAVASAGLDLVDSLRAQMPRPASLVPSDPRIVTAIVAMLAALLAWLALRFMPFAPAPPRARAPLAWRRLALTVAAAGLLCLRGFVHNPFLELDALRAIGIAPNDGRFGVFALGIIPILSAYLVIELAALCIPGWRRRRHAGADARLPLQRATGVLATVLALVQGFFLAVWMQGLGEPALAPGIGPEILVMMTLAAGCACLALLAGIVSRFGLGNGWAVLLLVDSVRGLATIPLELSPIAGLVAVALVTGWLLRRRLALASGATLRVPSAGLAPLDAGPIWGLVGSTLVALAAPIWALLGAPGQAVFAPMWATVLQAAGDGTGRYVLLGMLASLFSWLFARRRPEEVQRRLLPFGMVISFGFAAAVDYVGAASAAVVTAIALDLWTEFRGIGAKVVVETLHDVHEADEAAARHPGACLRGEHLRGLLFFFGPWVPIEVMAPRDPA